MEKDNINPDHYKKQCSLECIDAMIGMIGVQGVFYGCLMNVIKYLWRYENKNGVEDLKKAEWYINKACELLELDDTIENNDFMRIEQMYNKIMDENADAALY